jgi:hypothetical protein
VLASALAVALGLGVPEARADAPALQPVELFLTTTPSSPSCPTRSALEAAVALRLGSNPFQVGAARSLHVSVHEQAGRWLADLELREGEKVLGHQTLSSPSTECADLEPMLVLTLSVVCSAGPAVTALPEGDIEKQFSVTPEVASPKPNKPEGASSEGPTLWIGAGVLATGGAAKKVAFGGTVEVEAAWPWLSLGIQGRADLPTTSTIQAGQLETNLLYGALLPCGRLEPWSGCALIAFGSERASGSGYPGATTATSFYTGLGLQARVDLALSRHWEVRLHADLLFPLTRAEVHVQGEPVWQVPAVSFGLGAELLGALP